MKLITRILVFTLLNFFALFIGGLFTGGGVSSDWYAELNKAPWTPPGWVFGVAWTTIMICFSIYMGILYNRSSDRKGIGQIYVVQLLLNIMWNPLFFYFQNAVIALVVIIVLTLLVIYILFNHSKILKVYSALILPYAIWLCIATSLNLYIVTYN